jgi:hypothetical protein
MGSFLRARVYRREFDGCLTRDGYMSASAPLKSEGQLLKEGLMVKSKNKLNAGLRPKRVRAANLGNGLARWENEGGAPKSPWVEERIRRAELAEDEEAVLQRLGAGVIGQWADLPTDIQRKLFQTATSVATSHDTAKLKEQIARFLHAHGANSGGPRD